MLLERQKERFSARLTPHFRDRYRALNQFGLIPNGIESAPRIHHSSTTTSALLI